MRFASLVSLLVVTASFALGGCAADATPTPGETGTSEATNALGVARTLDVNGMHERYAARADEAARTRIFDMYAEVGANGAFREVGENVGRSRRIDVLEIDPATGNTIPSNERPQQQQLSVPLNDDEAHLATSTSGTKHAP